MKILAFCLLALPAGRLGWLAVSGGLGPLPYDEILISSGEWSMRLLVGGLAITPLRGLLGWSALARWRRMVGLFAAFYAFVHVSAYAANWSLDWGYLLGEVVARLYLTIGMLAVVALVPLTMTANDRAMGWLGGHRWRRLHALSYALAAVALVHFMLAGRLGTTEVWVLAGILGWALSYRVLARLRQRAGLGAVPAPWQQGLLGGVWTVLTLAAELAYFEYATVFGGAAILTAYLHPAAGIRPAAWLGAAAVAVSAAQMVRRRA